MTRLLFVIAAWGRLSSLRAESQSYRRLSGALRGAIGKKNYLFAGSDCGGECARLWKTHGMFLTIK
jgi:hypothetical protein